MDVRGVLSFGSWIIVILAIGSTCAVGLLPSPTHDGLDMWTFARPHYALYQPVAQQWNEQHTPTLRVYQLSLKAVERRMLSGFLSDTPVADLIEVDVDTARAAFAGPLADVGFVDLTERLQAEGLDRDMNAPSFSPWTKQDRIFGLPHDVHPVMLAYRADLVAAAGLNVDDVETWDDFVNRLRPLMADDDGNGRPDHYLLNFWTQQMDATEALLLQAGGGNFDSRGAVIIDCEVNVTVLCQLVCWITGPDRIAIDAEEFSPNGNRLKIEGTVIASLMPDWLGGVWKNDMPQLHGKIKLMPLPAWKPGGRRTSVWGGTMLGIAKSSKDVDAAWRMAKHLYLSQDLAVRLYGTNGIISPVQSFWKLACYDEPDRFFCGQAPGRQFIELAGNVPLRTSSPLNKFAKERVRDALQGLVDFANANRMFRPELLRDRARELLSVAKSAVEERVDRNVFLRGVR